MTERLLVIGDALLDRDLEGRVERLCPDAPVPVLDQTAAHVRPGGAALAAALAAVHGTPTTLVTAIAADTAGAELAQAILAAGVDLVDLGLDGRTPEKIRLLSSDGPLLRLDRGAGRVRAEGLGQALQAALARASAVLVSDYGRGVAAHPEVRAALAKGRRGRPLVWDPHPLGPSPLPGATMVTPNLEEAAGFADRATSPADESDLAELAAALATAWQAEAVCVTRGAKGALQSTPGDGVFTCRVGIGAEGDSCGAGDMFAARAAAELAVGHGREAAVAAAVAASSEFVAAGGARRARLRAEPTRAAGPGDDAGESPHSLLPALALREQVHRGGGTVVATGGCFDLLHLGHVRTLAAARELGDCLVVLLNSDRSVRRLKGRDRPLVAELERAAMLRALACVDEVAIFDEPTPGQALGLLRPDVWAKGGDYALERLPESEEIASWGGRTAILPYLEGRSTTKLIEEVGARVEA